MGPSRLSQLSVELRNNSVWMGGGAGGAGFLMWNATDYALISGTDRILINL